MTEVKWFESEDPDAMLSLVFGCSRPSDRKLRLFGIACHRRLWDLLPSGLDRNCIEIAERLADGLAGTEEAEQPFIGPNIAQAYVLVNRTAVEAAELGSACARAAMMKLRGIPSMRGERRNPDSVRGIADERAAQAHFFRDIFGNPFRPVVFSPLWRADTAVALALQMYDSRDFSAMPILADALQDAGCDNEEILNHCRSGDVHVRGCWVVDLVLAKE